MATASIHPEGVPMPLQGSEKKKPNFFHGPIKGHQSLGTTF